MAKMRALQQGLGVLLLFILGVVSAEQSDRALRNDFIQAMQQVEEKQRMEKAHVRLQDRLLRAAKRVFKPEEKEPEAERDLQNYGYNYGYNYNYNNNNNNNNNNQDAEGDDEEKRFYYSPYKALDLTNYALKYVGCQNIHTWNDEAAEDEDAENPLVMNRFVMLRLCPRDSCSSYNKWGCNSNYGEYMIPMEDYLAIMAEYHFTQFDRYCETCEACMNFEMDSGNQTSYVQAMEDDDSYLDDAYMAEQYQAQAANGNDNGYYANSNYNYGGGNRNLGDNNNNNYGQYYSNYYSNNYQQNYQYEYQNAYYNQYANSYQNGNYADNMYDGAGYYGQKNGNSNYYPYGYRQYRWNNLPWYIDTDGQCIFESVCNSYKNACRNYQPNATYYEDFFSCTAFDMGNNNYNVGYLGPHCRSDGRTIGIGIYSDEYCNQYVGDMVDIEQYTGMTFDDEEMINYYDKDCISCLASESFSLVTDDALAAAQYTYPLCNVLYDNSAKCNRYFGYSDTYDSYQSNQEAQEDDVCTFIGSLVENNYNEKGEIYSSDEAWKLSKVYNQGRKDVTRTSGFQKFLLVVSIGLCLGLFSYAYRLDDKLKKRMAWPAQPRNYKPFGPDGLAAEAGSISRAQSGIMAMRSRSVEDEGGHYHTNYTQGGDTGMSSITLSHGAYA